MNDPYSLPPAAVAVTFSLSVVTRTASMCKPLFASNRCLRSKLFTKSRVALPIAPPMLLASTFTVRRSVPVLRSSYFKVTLYVFKMISLCSLSAGWVCHFSLTYFLGRFRRGRVVHFQQRTSHYRACEISLRYSEYHLLRLDFVVPNTVWRSGLSLARADPSQKFSAIQTLQSVVGAGIAT